MKKNDYLVFVIIEIIAILAVAVCVVCNVKTEKSWLFILPLSYLIIAALFHVNFSDLINEPVKILIQTLCFIRLVIIPLLCVLNNSETLFEGKVSANSSFDDACMLVAYEFFMIQFTIFAFERVKFGKSLHIKSIIADNVDISKHLIICLAFFVILCMIAFPGYTSGFKTILDLSSEDFSTVSDTAEYSVGSFGRIISTLYSMGFQLLRILGPAILLRKTYKMDRKNLSKWILIILCVLQFFFVSSTFAESIIACMVTILYYMILYPEYSKRTIVALAISSLGIVVLYFTVRYFVRTPLGLYDKSSGPLLYAAQIINAYFSGVDNVAATFNIQPGHAYECIKSGVIGAIPFNTTIFGWQGHKLQYFFNEANHSYGQIPPTLGAGYYYFGYIFAPTLTMLFVFFSLKFNLMAKKNTNSLKFVSRMFCSIAFALGIGMYSPSITLSWFFSWGIPMIIITAFTNEKNEIS